LIIMPIRHIRPNIVYRKKKKRNNANAKGPEKTPARRPS
jgi:hypothetical protein